MSWLSDLIGSGAGDIIDGITDGIDKFVTTDDEKKQFEIAARDAKLKMRELAMEADNKYFEDRQSAREMFEKDSSLQKIFAIVFLSGYIGLSIAMVLIVFGFIFEGGPAADLTAFQASIISMVFTAMSTKVNTITDFLFGGSKASDNSEQRMARSFQINANKKE